VVFQHNLTAVTVTALATHASHGCHMTTIMSAQDALTQGTLVEDAQMISMSVRMEMEDVNTFAITKEGAITVHAEADFPLVITDARVSV